MNLQFKREQYNWGDKFYVYDEENQPKYRVKSSVMLWNRKFEICDLDKNVLAVIKNEPKSLVKKKFYIFINGEQAAAITKEISVIPEFTIEGLDWEMEGVMLREYNMTKHGQQVLSLQIEPTNWGTRPVLTIAKPADELLALAVVLTISYVMNAGEGGNPTNYL